MHKGRVRRVAIHVPDQDIMTTIVRGVGFRGACDCGWLGPREKSYAEARVDQREHQATAHANPSAPAA